MATHGKKPRIGFFARIMAIFAILTLLIYPVLAWAVLSYSATSLVVLWMVLISILSFGTQLWYWMGRYGIAR